MLGQYDFTLPDELTGGWMHSFRDPYDPEDYLAQIPEREKQFHLERGPYSQVTAVMTPRHQPTVVALAAREGGDCPPRPSGETGALTRRAAVGWRLHPAEAAPPPLRMGRR